MSAVRRPVPALFAQSALRYAAALPVQEKRSIMAALRMDLPVGWLCAFACWCQGRCRGWVRTKPCPCAFRFADGSMLMEPVSMERLHRSECRQTCCLYSHIEFFGSAHQLHGCVVHVAVLTPSCASGCWACTSHHIFQNWKVSSTLALSTLVTLLLRCGQPGMQHVQCADFRFGCSAWCQRLLPRRGNGRLWQCAAARVGQ